MRPDKTFRDVTTISQLAKQYQETKGIKLHLLKKDEDEAATAAEAKANATEPKRILKRRQIAESMDLYRGPVDVRSDIFTGLVVCVYNGVEDGITKQELEKILKENGATIMGMAREGKTNLVIVGRDSAIATDMIKKCQYDICRPHWVTDCARRKRRLPMLTRYMHCTTQQTREFVKANFDEYG